MVLCYCTNIVNYTILHGLFFFIFLCRSHDQIAQLEVESVLGFGKVALVLRKRIRILASGMDELGHAASVAEISYPAVRTFFAIIHRSRGEIIPFFGKGSLVVDVSDDPVLIVHEVGAGEDIAF